jgi:SPP1 gp7 family putative phage head morphogenesis protein
VGWLEQVGLRKSSTPAEAQRLQVATAAASQQMTGPAFAPGLPVQPTMGIGGQAKAWNVPAGYNIRSRPERDKRMSFEMLKALTDSYDIAAMCIAHRINSIRALPFMIVPDENLESNVAEAVKIAYRQMKKPDGQHSFRTWLAMYLEDMLRYDAPTLFKRRDRLGRPIALEVVSGTTIAPILDNYGRRPTGDAPAYVQYIQGQAFNWFKADDIIYEPYRPQSDSPYGIAPLEAVLMAANTDLRFQQHFLNYFTEGTVPEGFIILPDEASQAGQMKEFQEVFNSYMYGDMAAKRQLKVLPGGSKLEWSKDGEFNSGFAEFLMKKVCAAYHVPPQELGFTMDVNRATGDNQDDISFRTGDLPVINHLQDIITSYLQDDLGLPVKFKFDTGREDEDKVKAAQADKIHIETGVVSPDEIRELRYGLATDSEQRVPRFIMTSSGPVLLGTMIGEPRSVDADTAMPFVGHQLLSGGTAAAAPALESPAPAQPALEAAVPDAGPDVSQGAAPAPAGAITKGINEDYDLATFANDVLDEFERVQELNARPLSPICAGAAVKAFDTGRVLMIQRTLDSEDPAAGKWEFPGGHIDPGENAEGAARREWEEETGLSFPDDAMLLTTWDTSDGVYVGHVFRIAEEASIAINTGKGEDRETLAWFAPSDLPGFPALREELAEDLPVEGLAKGLRKEFAQWRSNSLSRLRRGQAPRRYRGAEFIPETAVEAVWTVLQKAQNDGDANSIFDTAIEAAVGATTPGGGAGPKARPAGSWRDEPPVATPQHAIDLRITDHYADQIRAALREFLTPEAANAVIEHGQEVSMVYGIESALREGATPESLSEVLSNLVREAYHAGDMAAKVQLGQDVPGWSIWAPGTPPEPLYADLGWEEALRQANITLKGISQETFDRIARIIEDGVQSGEAVDTMAHDIDAFLGDYDRAEMIAITETNRMVTLATEQQYRLANIPMFDWVISAGACPICSDKAASSPHPLGAETPPGHPYCRCAMSPVFNVPSTTP